MKLKKIVGMLLLNFAAFHGSAFAMMDPDDNANEKPIWGEVCSFDALSDEIKIMIFSNLTPSELLNINTVNHEWNRMSGDNDLWGKGLFKDIYSSNQEQYAKVAAVNNDGVVVGFLHTYRVENDVKIIDGCPFQWTFKNGLYVFNKHFQPVMYEYGYGFQDRIGRYSPGRVRPAIYVSNDNMILIDPDTSSEESPLALYDMGNQVYTPDKEDYIRESFSRSGSRFFKKTPPYSSSAWLTKSQLESSKITAINRDCTIVGETGSNDLRTEAFRLKHKDEYIIHLGKLPNLDRSFATDLSDDATVIIGNGYQGSRGSRKYKAFIWEEKDDKGMSLLGTLKGDIYSKARAISRDGRIIVGKSFKNKSVANENHAFVWTATKGMRSIETILKGLNNLPEGWHLTDATGISTNGKYIIGKGLFNSNERSWRAEMPIAFLH